MAACLRLATKHTDPNRTLNLCRLAFYTLNPTSNEDVLSKVEIPSSSKGAMFLGGMLQAGISCSFQELHVW